MTDLPEPLVPPDVDISGLDGFMLDVQRLFASELWALSTGDEFKAAIALWGRAWQQVPPGSLPKDEKVLAAFSGAGVRWKKVRTMALRGFVECSDGRLYHRVLCEDVLNADKKRKAFKQRTEAATMARRQRNVVHERQRNDDRNDNDLGDVTSVQGQGQKERKEERKNPNPESASPTISAEPAGLPRSEIINFKTEIIKRFRALNLQQTPETGHAEVWLAQGYDPALCLAVIAEGLPRKPDVRGLKYFDGAIRDAHEKRATNGSAPPATKERTFDLGGEFREVPARNIPGIIKIYEERGRWLAPSPPPGEPGCLIPDDLLPEKYRVKRLFRVGDDATEITGA